MANKCHKCDYYDKLDDDFGLCKRYPPNASVLARQVASLNVYDQTIDMRRPRMSKNDICGDFKETA